MHPFGNPRVEPAHGLDTLLRGAKMSTEAKTVLVSKCADCHSSETRWPVYARVAPGSWLIERDIIEARKKMDLSRWGEMPADAQDLMIAKIIHEAKSGDMPPLQYRMLHWRAQLTQIDVAALLMMKTKGGGDGETDTSESGDSVRGKTVLRNAARAVMRWRKIERDRNWPGYLAERPGAWRGLKTRLG